MMYKYKDLLSRKVAAKKVNGMHLIAMSVSINSKNQIKPAYLVADPRYTKDLKVWQFSTFMTASQDALNDYLNDDPSGLFQAQANNTWLIGEGNPLYSYRYFDVKNVHYCVLRVMDAGLIYNILFGSIYEVPYMLGIKRELTSNADLYNLSDLFNLGLLGRISHVELKTDLFKSSYDLPTDISLAPLSYDNETANQYPKRYQLALFNGTKEPTILKSFANWKAAQIIPDQKSVKDWMKQQTFPYVTYVFRADNQKLSIKMRPLLANSDNQQTSNTANE